MDPLYYLSLAGRRPRGVCPPDSRDDRWSRPTPADRERRRRRDRYHRSRRRLATEPVDRPRDGSEDRDWTPASRRQAPPGRLRSTPRAGAAGVVVLLVGVVLSISVFGERFVAP